MEQFKKFLLLEQEQFLAQKIGEVLTALQSLEEDGTNLGNRQLLRNAENIVNYMRKIISSQWSKEELGYLKRIRKVAVALAKAIDSNADMRDVITNAKNELENLQKDLGLPINRM